MSKLLNHYSLASCIDFYHLKYIKQMSAVSIPQATAYFEESENPIRLNNQTRESVKKNIRLKVRESLA